MPRGRNLFHAVRGFTPLLLTVALASQAASSHADEPSRLGRLFRFGNSSNSNRDPKPAAPNPGPIRAIPNPPGLPDAGALPRTPDVPSDAPLNRIAPQSRSAKPSTEADPIVTRASIGRADSGSRFGMFLQVYADGTVIDSEGVHKVGHDVMRPVLESLRQGDLYRLKGHCGVPSADFIETTHMIVYERALGRLRAYSFSFSGSGKGCDASVQRLNAALDALQAKISAASSAVTTTSGIQSVGTDARTRGTLTEGSARQAAVAAPATMPPAAVMPRVGALDSPKPITLTPEQ